MKVLQINKLYPPAIGGVESVVNDLVHELSKSVDVDVLVCNDRFRRAVERCGRTTIYRVPSLGTYLSMPIAISFPLELKRLAADIYHYHMPFPLGDVSHLLAKPKGKVVATWHSSIVRQRAIKPFYRPIMTEFLNKVDRIIVTSPQMAKYSAELHPFREKCEVIPIGIDLAPFEQLMCADECSLLKRELDPQGKGIVLFVGRFVYYKGVEVLIQAMATVDATLVLVGQGPLETRLHEQVSALGIGHRVRFIRHVEKNSLNRIFQACDVFVLPSVAESEAFGLVQVEAMASAKPVISTRLPTGVPFVNLHDHTGFTVEPGNVHELARALQLLMQNPSLRRQLGAQGRRRAFAEFDRTIMGRRVAALYRRLLGVN